MLICCADARESVWVGVPLEGAVPASPVSVTVIVYGEVPGGCAADFEADAGVATVNTLMLLTTGGMFCGIYARVTLSRTELAPSSAFHWINRALGLFTDPAAVIGSAQSLQVLSGRSEFPDRVRNWSPLPSARQLSRPQRATPPAS